MGLPVLDDVSPRAGPKVDSSAALNRPFQAPGIMDEVAVAVRLVAAELPFVSSTLPVSSR